MVRKFTEIAFTPAVVALQERYGSREMYQRLAEKGPENDTLIPRVAEFIQARESFYLGTVGETGWPYIQFRGGPVGFLKILDDKTLGFADFAGNCQYLTLGHLSVEARVFLFLMDYRNQRRLKIWGRARTVEDDPELLSQLVDPSYPATPERGIIITVEAWDWNCPQHIPIRYSEAEVEAMITPLQARIQELEAQLGQESDQVGIHSRS
ncbi:MAG: pyridoxamine 5'-phosphate oxidase family protein [Oscillatoriales cyanobacterium RM1_1_9]|nr:pyridoxamine 5'-phosphate oxidase family protein [Oscillatoriales cyanobacterium SM2_3_0]NJO46816.1 pyridoxamine 5'-phosphate oxidase family protein [Oscillatoriales cyanobacterium RM2_1_1]NJO71427.1 pyridoxamine 5'-phosphate oxidase family protein [Oscillatoriales cyanobacterium RM1_1_9]